MEQYLLNTREIAKYLGVSNSYMKQMRLRNCGPKYFKFGRLIRYRLSDVHRWIAKNDLSVAIHQAAAFRSRPSRLAIR